MSVEAISSCWGAAFPAAADGISPATVRVVALAIADVVNDMHGNEFYGARKMVARKIGCDPDTVGDVIRHLIDHDVMEVVDRKPGRPVRYRWLWTTSGGSPHPLRRTTATPAVTSPQHKTKRSQVEHACRRDYDHQPLTPEEIGAKYGVEV